MYDDSTWQEIYEWRHAINRSIYHATKWLPGRFRRLARRVLFCNMRRPAFARKLKREAPLHA